MIKIENMRYVFILIVVVTCFSCKKETIDKTPKLLSRTWKMTAWEVVTPLQGTPLEGQSSNWYAPGGCYSEMTWDFQSNGDLIIKDAPSCIPSGSSGVYNSRWILVNNNKEINVTGSPFATFTYNIVSLTATKLVVQRNETVGYSGGTINLLLQREYTAQ